MQKHPSYPPRENQRRRAARRDDHPKFGPPRPDLDRGMRGERVSGESASYGPRSDTRDDVVPARPRTGHR
jgi:hypothetical protein